MSMVNLTMMVCNSLPDGCWCLCNANHFIFWNLAIDTTQYIQYYKNLIISDFYLKQKLQEFYNQTFIIQKLNLHKDFKYMNADITSYNFYFSIFGSFLK